MNKNSKIYVAGHTGMVGSSIVRYLNNLGYKNLILKTRQELNLVDQSVVKNFFEQEKIDYAILAAALVGGIKANMTYPADYLYQNLQIQNNVIWQAHLIGIKKFLFLGSSCIYPRNCPQPMKEEYLLDGKPEPTNEGYAIAKIAGLKLCEKIYDQFNKNFISCVPSNIYGINDHFDPNTGHVIPSLIRRFHEAKINKAPKIVIWGAGTARREFMFVDDLSDAVLWLMKNYNEKQFLNIGTGEDVSIKELAYLIKDIVGYQGELIFDTSKPEGMPRKLVDVSKINSLGWKAKTKLEDGLKITYKWYRQTLNQTATKQYGNHN